MQGKAILSMALALFYFGCSAIAADTAQLDSTLFRGRLRILVADNFTDGTSKTAYLLTIDGESRDMNLRFKDKNKIPILRSGMRVEVLGLQNNKFIDVAQIKILSAPSD